ncbi:LysR family transcriptional regulator [Azorhizobium oxalatiphilum]|uniref:LysR family transcriptional regulator n=1 Tax=Azorhizobium oxalatiphilum TaxID=980631 RepID=UPI0016658CA8|nr:LysR family transcriptional regulator [Azorhizobium oxalatiphilum]
MEWSDLRIFLAVARTGTQSAAAKALNLSHPTIGRRLRALEAALGQALFQRTAEGFVLTDEGTAILALAEEMEEATQAIRRRVSGAEALLAGRLRVSCSDWVGAFVLPEVVGAYAAAHPQVEVDLLSASRLYSLAQREADIAFRVVPFEEADIVQRRLAVLPFAAYAAADVAPRVGAGGAGLTLIEDAPHGERDVLAQSWLRQRLPQAGRVFLSNSRTVQARLCVAGVGLACLPRAVGDRTAGLTRLDLGAEPPSRELWMGYHRDLKRLTRLRAFADTAVRLLAG